MQTSKWLILGVAAVAMCVGGVGPVSLAAPVPVPPPNGDAGAATILPNGTSTLTDSGTYGTTTANPIVFHDASTGGSAPDGEATAVNGVTHDYFLLTVDPTFTTGGNAGKDVVVTITWTNPSTDYDLFLHKSTTVGATSTESDPVVATSAGGAPSTQEQVTISPTQTGTGSYYISIVYFTVADAAALPYSGTVLVASAPTTNQNATYLPPYTSTPNITFSPNTPCKSPSAAQQGEPASRIDSQGHYYISGIEGVPAGVDLWYFDLVPGSNTYDPQMTTPLYRGQPDSLTSSSPVTGESGVLPAFSSGGVGGGDVDVATGFPTTASPNGDYTGTDAPTNPYPALAMSSLTAANVTTFRSLDLGMTFTKDVIGNAAGGVPVNDRQWMQFYGNNTIYLEYRNFGAGVAFIQQSTNGGLTYTNGTTVVGTIPQTGYIDVDQHDGTVYVAGNDGSVSVGTPTVVGGQSLITTFTKYQATASTSVANIFFCTRVANDYASNVSGHNTLYSVYSDGKNIFLVYSLDQAKTWSSPVQVNNPNDPNTKTNLLPWFAAGPTPGTVGVVWYGTDDAVNDDTSKYRVYYAYGTGANTGTPNFDIVKASDHSNHAANISLNGLAVTGSPNRNLIDYFQIQFDPKGAAVIGYTDDHNDFQGFTYVTRQQTGPAPFGTLTAAAPGSGLAAESAMAATETATQTAQPPPQPGPNGEQVTDFQNDQTIGLVGAVPSASPLDIQTIKYQVQGSGASLAITAAMVVSNLATIPASTNWRMYFTANAPEAGTLAGPPHSRYSTGLSDRGDQFYIEAVSGASSGSAAVFNYGTVIRNFDGSLTSTKVGSADLGSFTRQNRTISVRISVSKLNAALDVEKAALTPAQLAAALAINPNRYKHIGSGTVLCGLRGTTYDDPSGGAATGDATRGGTELLIP